MIKLVIWFVVAGSILFIVLAAIAYLVVRLLFVRLADRVSTQIAAQLERNATNAFPKVRERVKQLADRPAALQTLEVSRAVGSKIRSFATTRGLNIEDAKVAFFGRMDNTARLMDRAIQLPLIGGVGFDALLGLIPFVGDAISAVVAGSIILNSLQYGLPKALVSRMIANVFVDLLFGAVPVLGDLFDVIFKANTRNVNLVRAYLSTVRA